LILIKISKFDATSCQILRLKFDFRLGSTPDPAGSLQRSPDPLPVFKGAYFQGERGKEGGERRGEGKGREREK